MNELDWSVAIRIAERHYPEQPVVTDMELMLQRVWQNLGPHWCFS